MVSDYISNYSPNAQIWACNKCWLYKVYLISFFKRLTYKDCAHFSKMPGSFTSLLFLCCKLIRCLTQIQDQRPPRLPQLFYQREKMTANPWESASRQGCALSQQYGYTQSTAEPADFWNSTLYFNKSRIYDLRSPTSLSFCLSFTL